MAFKTRRAVSQIQSLIHELISSLDNDPKTPPKKGSGKRTTRKEEVRDFRNIKIIAKSKIKAVCNIVVGAEQPEVEIEIDDNLQDVIDLDASDGKLTIKSTTKCKSKEGLIINIKTKSLEGIAQEGSAIMNVQNFDNDKFIARMAGAARLTVDGKVSSVKIAASGSVENIDLSNLLAKEMDLIISGMGNARVNVSEKLRVVISGTGNVLYKGDPIVDKRISGVGFVTSWKIDS